MFCKIIAPIIVSTIFFFSCGSTHLIQRTDSAYREVNKELKGKIVTIEKVNGEEISGKYVGIFPDSVTVDKETVAIENVADIKTNNHTKGTFAGMGWGFLSGLLIGGIVGELTATESESNSKFNIPVGISKGAVIGITGALAGLVFGGVYGGVTGIYDHFTFAPYSRIDSVSVSSESKKADQLVHVVFTSILEQGRGYIIILWKERKIRLSRTEYSYRGTTEDEKPFIVVPGSVYDSKFQRE